MNTNFEEVRQFLSLLAAYGVTHTNIRTFESLNNKTSSKIFPTDLVGIDAAISYISSQHFDKGTVNATFNQLCTEVVEANRAVADKDIIETKFILIDVDPERPAGVSATNQEKEDARKVSLQIEKFLKENGINQIIQCDSGNGFHTFLPISCGEIEKPKEIIHRFLKMLDVKFGNKSVKVDTSVANPARLCKLIGTPAIKGEDTEERPHRISSLISFPEKLGISNLLQSIEKLVNEYTPTGNEVIRTSQISGKSSKNHVEKASRDWMHADVHKWLAAYSNLKYSTKSGDVEGVTLYIFEKCPLRDHQNNTDGSMLSVTKDQRVRFKCLHESCQDKNIFDFAKEYPIPSEASLEKGKDDLVTTEVLDTGCVFHIGDFELSSKGIFLNREGKNSLKISSPLFVGNVFQNKETQIIHLTLCYYVNQKWQLLSISGEDLQINYFKKLAKYGISISARNEADVIDFIQNQRSNVPIIMEHDTLGWVNKDETLIYQLDRSYGTYEASTLSSNMPYNLKSAGSFESFDAFIKKNVLGTNLELAWAIGVAPIALGYFNVSKKKALNTLLVNLQAPSSTGKTTTLMFIASLFGEPGTIVRNLNATHNAIIKLASKNHGGTPLILDELGSSNQTDLSSLLYQLASGEGKARLDSNSELRKQEKFDVFTLMSSEERIEYYLQKNLHGLKVRRLEFNDIQFLKDAENAEVVKESVQQVYGWCVPALIERLFQQGLDKMDAWFDESKAVLLPQMAEDSKKGRIADNLSLVHMAALMIKNLLNYSLNVDKIDKYLLAAYNSLIAESTLAEVDVFERVKILLAMNGQRFITKNQSKNYGGNWGKATLTSDGMVKVNILTIPFEDLLKKEFQVRDVSYIIKELLETGDMKAEKGRRTKRVRIDKKNLTTYEILLPADVKCYFGFSNLSGLGDTEVATASVVNLGLNEVPTQTALEQIN